MYRSIGAKLLRLCRQLRGGKSTSIICLTVSYQSDRWLRPLLESIANHRSDVFSVEVVLIDNSRLPEDVLKDCGQIIPSVRYIKCRENMMYGGGNNVGLAYINKSCEFSYVLIANPDTKFSTGSLELLVEAAMENPAYGVLAGIQLEYSSGDANVSSRSQVDLSRLKDSGIVDVRWVEGSAMMITKRCLDSIGGFDPLYKMYYEDFDLCRRARKAGFKVGVVPAVRYHHYSNASFKHKAEPERVKLIDQSQFIFQLTDPEYSWETNHLRVVRWLVARTIKWLTGHQPGFGHGLRAIFREYKSRYRVIRDNWRSRATGDYFAPLPNLNETIEETYTISSKYSTNEVE